MPKDTTGELPNMPKLDGVGTAAQNYQTALEELVAAQEKKGTAGALLHKALVKAKRASIQINGYKFERIHTGPKDSIKVTKPK